MKKLILVFIYTTSLSIFAKTSPTFSQMWSSSFPPDTNKTLLDLPTEKERKTLTKIRVLIFPHTLKNDWRHGKKDNPKTFELVSEKKDILINHKKYQRVIFERKKNTTLIHAIENDQSIRIKTSLPLNIKLKSATKLLRVGNEEKSSSYESELKVFEFKDGFRVVNTMGLSQYLKGVVPSESSPTWPLEALKAQAVAARSYAVFHKLSTPSSREYDVDDTARYQVYTGVSHHHPRTNQAVRDTLGEILTYQDKVIIAFFHAYSGGETDSARNIFKMNNIPYCKGALESFTNSELREVLPANIHWVIEWNKSWKKSEFMTILKKLKEFNDFKEDQTYEVIVTERNDTYNGSIKMMSFIQGNNKVEMDHFKLRSTLGWSNFNSYHFFFKNQDQENIEFKGLGWGHHVGMSQWSAYYMAKYQSSTYQEILDKFYFDTSLTKL